MLPPCQIPTHMLQYLTGLPLAKIQDIGLWNGARPPNPNTNALQLYLCSHQRLLPRTTSSSSSMVKNRSTTLPIPPFYQSPLSAFAGRLRKTTKMVRQFLSFVTPHPLIYARLPLPCGSSTTRINYTRCQDFLSQFAKFPIDQPNFSISWHQKQLPSYALLPATPTTCPPCILMSRHGLHIPSVSRLQIFSTAQNSPTLSSRIVSASAATLSSCTFATHSTWPVPTPQPSLSTSMASSHPTLPICTQPNPMRISHPVRCSTPSFFWFVSPQWPCSIAISNSQVLNCSLPSALPAHTSLTNGRSTELLGAVPISYQRFSNRLLEDLVGILKQLSLIYATLP